MFSKGIKGRKIISYITILALVMTILPTMASYSYASEDFLNSDRDHVYVSTTISGEEKWVPVDLEKAKVTSSNPNGAVVTAAYGSISNSKAKVKLYAYIESDVSVTKGLKWDYYADVYAGSFTKDSNGNMIATFTVESYEGKEQKYKITLKESTGDSTELTDLYVSFYDGIIGEYDQESWFMDDIDIEAAASSEGATYVVPYEYNDESGIEINAENEYDFSKIELNKSYHFGNNSNMTVVIPVTSPNGKYKKEYKINFVRDTAGSVAELEKLSVEYGYIDEDYSEDKTVVLDVNKAASSEGERFELSSHKYNPVEGFGYMHLNMKAKNHGYFRFKDEDGREVTTKYIDEYFHYYLGDEETTFEFDVVSQDKKNSKHYKVTLNWEGCKFVNYVVEQKASFNYEGYKTAECEGDTCNKSHTAIIANIKVPSIKSYTFDNKVKKPTFKLKDYDGNEVPMKLTYASGRKKVGKYAVKITVPENEFYEGTKTVYFKINPKGVNISALTKGSKSFTVKWKKPTATYRKQMTGYQIKYSTSSKMNNAKTVTVKSTTATSKKITKLKSKKKYYVQIRTYKVVNGTKYYSNWSDKKSITTK